MLDITFDDAADNAQPAATSAIDQLQELAKTEFVSFPSLCCLVHPLLLDSSLNASDSVQPAAQSAVEHLQRQTLEASLGTHRLVYLSVLHILVESTS